MNHPLAIMKHAISQRLSRGLCVPAFSVLCFLWTGFISPISAGDVSAGGSAAAENNPPQAAAHSHPGLDTLTEIPLSAQPRLKTLSETQQDRLHCEDLFMQARILQASGKLPEALRKYQRAYRYSANAETILANVVSLAADLERPDELLTYFRKMKNFRKMDVIALREVGVQLTIQDAWPEAVEVFQAALESSVVRANPAALVFLRQDMGRTLYVLGKYEEAASCFRYVFRAMQHPERYDLDELMVSAVMADAAFYYSIMADANLLSGNLEQAELLLESSILAQHNDLQQSGVPRRQQETRRKVITVTADFTRAKIAFQRKDYADAKTLLELVITDLKADAQLGEAPYKWYADTLEAMGQSEKIVPELMKLYQREPENSILGFFLAKRLMQNARGEADVASVRDPLNQAEFILKKHTAKHPVTARLADILEISARLGDTAHFWQSLEYVFQQVKSTDDMILVLRMAMRKMTEPSAPADTAKDENAAEDETVTHLDEEPQEPENPVALAKAEETAEKASVVETWKGTPAMAVLEKAAAEGRGQVKAGSPWRALWLMGFLEELLGNNARAEECYQAAEASLAKQKPQPDAVNFFIERGFARTQQNTHAAAARAFRTAIAHAADKPAQHRARFYLSSILMLDQQYEQALEQADAILRENPKYAAAELQRAVILYHAGRHADADREYARFIRKYDKDYENPITREMLREARLTLSVLAHQAGRADEAEELLEEVMDEFPDDVNPQNDLAYLWSQRGVHLRRATRMAETCVAEAPENAAYHDTLGWVYYQSGDYEKAESALMKAAEIQPDPVIMSHLGDVCLKRGKPAEAEKHWRESLRLFAEYHEEGKNVIPEEESHVRRRLAELEAP